MKKIFFIPVILVYALSLKVILVVLTSGLIILGVPASVINEALDN